MQYDTKCLRSDHEIIFRTLEDTIGLCCKMYPGARYFTDDVEKIKSDLNNGIRNPACSTCWKYEDIGTKSWRMQGNEHYSALPDKYQIELYFDNTCDSACVYCSKTYSSNWDQEIRRTNYEPPQWANNTNIPNVDRQKYADYIFKYITQVAKEKTQTGGFFEIILLGGEPMLTSINKKLIMDLAIESFFKEVDPDTYLLLSIQTNANTPTKLMDSCLKKIEYYKKKYKNLNFLVSISAESVGKVFEYIRYGCSYTKFLENFKKWADSGCMLNTNMSINSISLCSTKDYLELLTQISKEHGVQVDVAANMVYSPMPMSLGILDNRFKKYCQEALDYAAENKQHFKNYEEIVDKLKTVNSIIGTNNNIKDIYRLKQATDYFENVRKLKIKDINPELYFYMNEKLNNGDINV